MTDRIGIDDSSWLVIFHGDFVQSATCTRHEYGASSIRGKHLRQLAKLKCWELASEQRAPYFDAI